jgi:hypothetical protein
VKRLKNTKRDDLLTTLSRMLKMRYQVNYELQERNGTEIARFGGGTVCVA